MEWEIFLWPSWKTQSASDCFVHVVLLLTFFKSLVKITSKSKLCDLTEEVRAKSRDDLFFGYA